MVAMDALIMAAGRGSRLGAHTDDRPKALVDLGGISPLELQLDVLADRGVERVILVTGYRRGEVEAAAITRADGRLAVEPVWNPFWSVTNVVGSAWMARDRLAGPFVYLHADTVFEPSILDDLLASADEAVLPVDVRPCEPEQMKAQVVDGRIVHLSKELADADTTGEFIGIGVFRGAAVPAVRTALDAVLAAGALTGYFEAALNVAIDDGLTIRPLPTDGRPWTEIDFEEDLELARSLLPRLRPPR
jgi:choline kinase